MKYIDAEQVKKLAYSLRKNGYGKYLLNMIKTNEVYRNKNI
jgi:dTDP-glucose pyrophosphorylase